MNKTLNDDEEVSQKHPAFGNIVPSYEEDSSKKRKRSQSFEDTSDSENEVDIKRRITEKSMMK